MHCSGQLSITIYECRPAVIHGHFGLEHLNPMEVADGRKSIVASKFGLQESLNGAGFPPERTKGSLSLSECLAA